MLSMTGRRSEITATKVSAVDRARWAGDCTRREASVSLNIDCTLPCPRRRDVELAEALLRALGSALEPAVSG